MNLGFRKRPRPTSAGASAGGGAGGGKEDGGNDEDDAGNDDDDDGGDDEDDAGLLLALDSRQARCELFFCSKVTNRGQQLKVFNLLIPKLDRFFVGFVFLTICLGFGRSGASKHSLEYYFCTP